MPNCIKKKEKNVLNTSFCLKYIIENASKNHFYHGTHTGHTQNYLPLYSDFFVLSRF